MEWNFPAIKETKCKCAKEKGKEKGGTFSRAFDARKEGVGGVRREGIGGVGEIHSMVISEGVFGGIRGGKRVGRGSKVSEGRFGVDAGQTACCTNCSCSGSWWCSSVSVQMARHRPLPCRFWDSTKKIRPPTHRNFYCCSLARSYIFHRITPQPLAFSTFLKMPCAIIS